jgi:hypothetical protein
MRAPAFTALAATALLLSACAADQGTPKSASSTAANPRNAPAGAVPAVANGKPIGCVQLQSIRETRVVDDKTIDFYMRDGRVLRNNLPGSCPQLGFERAFSYSTSISQLCNVDIITVIQQSGGIRRGASCGLGMFTPITPPAK